MSGFVRHELSSEFNTAIARARQDGKTSAFEQLPTEIRRDIFRYALTWQAADFEEPNYWRVRPFDRPVVYVYINNDIRMSGPQRAAPKGFWGTEPMTRLMRVSKRSHAEIHDLMYGSFAFYLSSPFRRDRDFQSWRDWLAARNPHALNKIGHFIMHFNSPDPPWLMEDMKSRPEYQFSRLFPNMSSITIQCLLIERSLDSFLSEEAHAEALFLKVRLWKESGINTLVSNHPCNGERGQVLVALVQEKNKQAQKEAIAHDQGVRFYNNKNNGSIEEAANGTWWSIFMADC